VPDSLTREESRCRLRKPFGSPRQKILYPEQVSMNKRKLGSIRPIPRKQCLEYLFTFLILFMRLKTGFKQKPAAPNGQTSCQTNEYFVRTGPQA
jgi:hypothetical protein